MAANCLDRPPHPGLAGAMKPAAKCKVVLVTAPDLKTARSLARAALQARLTACVNLVPGLESHYWWRGKVERGNEVLLLLKTTRACLVKLERLIVTRHPYDTPEFVVLTPAGGNRRYLDWVVASCSISRTNPQLKHFC
jgi:periplasmic divalent cation tolerance protein